MNKYLQLSAALSLACSAYAENAVETETYRYDASGNIIEKQVDGRVVTSQFDASNRLLNSGDKQYKYDQAGRPIEIASGTQRKSLSYGYDDRVLEVKSADSTTELYYNAAGQLVGKSNKSSTQSSELFIWDEHALAARGDEVYTNEEHLSGGVPVLSTKQTAGGKKQEQMVVSDYLGNTLMSGEEHHQGSAYGEGLEKARFTGKPYVAELESYVFPCRNYNATAGSWTTADPSGFPDGRNQLEYVNGDPLHKIDPMGLEFQLAVSEGSYYCGNTIYTPEELRVSGLITVTKTTPNECIIKIESQSWYSYFNMIAETVKYRVQANPVSGEISVGRVDPPDPFQYDYDGYEDGNGYEESHYSVLSLTSNYSLSDNIDNGVVNGTLNIQPACTASLYYYWLNVPQVSCSQPLIMSSIYVELRQK